MGVGERDEGVPLADHDDHQRDGDGGENAERHQQKAQDEAGKDHGYRPNRKLLNPGAFGSLT